MVGAEPCFTDLLLVTDITFATTSTGHFHETTFTFSTATKRYFLLGCFIEGLLLKDLKVHETFPLGTRLAIGRETGEALPFFQSG